MLARLSSPLLPPLHGLQERCEPARCLSWRRMALHNDLYRPEHKPDREQQDPSQLTARTPQNQREGPCYEPEVNLWTL